MIPLKSATDGSRKPRLTRAVHVWSELPETRHDHNACQNCGQTSERLTFIPEFEYMGCDDCVAEALAVLANEKSLPIRPWEACAARLALANECSTVSEFRRALRAHVEECAICGFECRTVPSDHRPLDTRTVPCKEVAQCATPHQDPFRWKRTEDSRSANSHQPEFNRNE